MQAFNNVWSLRACLDEFISQIDNTCWTLSKSLTTDKIKLQYHLGNKKCI